MRTTTNLPTNSAALHRGTAAPRSGASRRSPLRTFAQHYAEMVVAMVLGMFVLGAALAVPPELAGVAVSSWDTEAPALLLLAMAFTMTVPMVAWMRYRGHRAPAMDMAGAMFLPSFAAVGLLWAGIQADIHVLLEIRHVAMLPAMLVAMLLRRQEYTGHHSRPAPGAPPRTLRP